MLVSRTPSFSVASMQLSDLPLVDHDDFVRRFSQRASKLMWLLGAGASASSGVPTAWEMIWEFKQRIYSSQRHVSIRSVSDLSNPAVQRLLQSHIDSSGAYPQYGAPDEYASLFEAAWPSEIDRQIYIEGKLRGAKVGYGQLGLATLMQGSLTRIVWTTNFDALISDACAKIYGNTSSLTTASLDAPSLAREAINAQRWPVEVKLHGDFRSRRLKNTSDELREQDAGLRRLLVDCCQQNGLVVGGYSGRDSSIMETLRTSLEGPSPFPGGLFWLHRGDNPPLPAVSELLRACAMSGIEAGLVRIENLDETVRDLVRQFDKLDTSVLDSFAYQKRVWTAPALLTGARGFPVIRLNALPIVSMPTVCRKVVCNIGGYAELREAIASTGADVIVARSSAGVLAFGSDSAVRTLLASHHIEEFDLHSIEVGRLRYETAERGLLREALSRGVARKLELKLFHRSRADHLCPANEADPRWDGLRSLVGQELSGELDPCSQLRWYEGLSLKLDWASDQLWLLYEPRLIFEGVNAGNKSIATSFGRERTFSRYNKHLNALVDYWAKQISSNGEDHRALQISDGVDAVFRFGPITAFSRRVRA